MRPDSFLSGVERKPGAQKRLFFNILAPFPGAAAAHSRVPDSSSVSASNVPSAPEPNDVYRHAFCPSSRLRPNAPFQLLRTGRWRCAPGGCAHRPALFSSSRPHVHQKPRRDPVGSTQCSHSSGQFTSSEAAGVRTLVDLLPSVLLTACNTPLPPPSKNTFSGINLWERCSCEDSDPSCSQSARLSPSAGRAGK